MAPKAANKQAKAASAAKNKATAKVCAIGRGAEEKSPSRPRTTSHPYTLLTHPNPQSVEDKTFGLKNKNKSAKVQQ
jgi:hypothetical protein